MHYEDPRDINVLEKTLELKIAQFRIKEEIMKKEINFLKSKVKHVEKLCLHPNHEYLIKLFEVELHKNQQKLINLEVKCLQIKCDLLNMKCNSNLANVVIGQPLEMIKPIEQIKEKTPTPLEPIRESPIKKVRKMRKKWRESPLKELVVSPIKELVVSPIKSPPKILKVLTKSPSKSPKTPQKPEAPKKPAPSPRPTQDYETKKSKKGLFSFKSMLSMTKLQPPTLKKK